MNELLKDGIMILSGIIGGYLFLKIRQKIVAQTKSVVEEKVSLPKFINGMTNVTSKVGWLKDIHDILNLRKLIIIGVIIGCIYGYGWYRGKQGVQPILDWHGKEEWVQLNEHYLHVKPDGTMEVVDSDKKTILKKITVKDLENLKKNLRPYGFHLKPFVTAGGSLGNKAGFEAGAGIDFFKWFKWNTNAFLTNLGAYLGVGYQITDNFDIMLGAGKGWREGDTRVGLFGKWRF
jgi:hypothetical protein